jgi:hypothetical protein
MRREAIEAELGEPDAAEKGYLDWHAAGVKAGVNGGVVASLMFTGADDPHNPGFASFSGETAEGIGIGSSVDAVKSAYGEPANVYDGIFLSLGYDDFEFVCQGGRVVSIQISGDVSGAMRSLGVDELEERDLEWFEDGYENPNSIEFARVLHAPGNLTLTAAQARELLNYETETALVVDGNLVVDGPLNIEDHHAVVVGNDIRCRSLSLAAGQLKCEALRAAEYVHYEADDTQRMETVDVRTLEVPLLWAPYIEPEEFAGSVSFQWCEIEVEEETVALIRLLERDFAAVRAALADEVAIDDEWVREYAAAEE